MADQPNPPPAPPPGPDFASFERRCPKCRQLVGDDFWCPECSSAKPTFVFTGLFLAVGVLGAYAQDLMRSAAAVKAAMVFGLSGVCLYGLYALLAHRARWRALVQDNPALVAERIREKQERLARRDQFLGFAPAPPDGPVCPCCRSVLDGQGWCFRCAKRRQNQLLVGVSLGSMVLGTGACSLAYAPSQGPLERVLGYLGPILFVGVPFVCFLLSARRPRRAERKHDE